MIHERTNGDENAVEVKKDHRAGRCMACGQKTITNGGDNDLHKEKCKTPRPRQKGKPPKLLQQSGGTPRSEKRRLHLRTV